MWTYQVSLEQRAMDNKLFFRLTPYYTDAKISSPVSGTRTLSTPGARSCILKISLKWKSRELMWNCPMICKTPHPFCQL